MPPKGSEFEQEMVQLENELRRLEAEYNMFFAGRLPKPPWETRSRVDAIVKQMDRAYIQNTGDRFRFHTLQSRFATFIDLWDRGMRAREEGRSGPFPQKKSPDKAERGNDKVMHVASFSDPLREMDKLHDLYDSLAEARRTVGEEAVPFHKFAELVKTQVNQLKAKGSGEVAFRVALKDGKVAFTAKGTKKG